MKTEILPFLLILLISCGQPGKEKIFNNINGIPSDTASTGSVEEHEKTETQSFSNLDSAMLVPDKVIHIHDLGERYSDSKHLPSQLGTLINLKILEFACLENLEDIPTEIGQLKKLEKLIIDNGNGCRMNISIPSSIGQLQNLKELKLYGAIDPREIGNCDTTIPQSKIKSLPREIANLKSLEVLDLGRNGLQSVPPQIAYLNKLKILRLDWNDVQEIPDFISNLTNLQEISINGNHRIVKLPNSLRNFKKLNVFMGDDCVKLKDQKELKSSFPNIVFSFESEYDQSPECEE